MSIPEGNISIASPNWRREVKRFLDKLKTQFSGGYYTSSYPSFSTLLSTIGSTSATIYVNSTVTLTANTTTPSNVHLVPLKGGGFTSSSAYTLTVNGTVEAGNYQWIYGSVTLVFGSNVLDYIVPQWFGDMLTDREDATAAAQLAVI